MTDSWNTSATWAPNGNASSQLSFEQDDSGASDSVTYALFTFQAVIFALICIIGLIGNSLVIYVVSCFSKMQTVTNMYILNLAIADELFIIGLPCLIVTVIKRGWVFGNALCKIYLILTGINQYTSSTFLCIMSADRYVAVCHPISSPKWRTPFISTIISVAAWLWSLLLIVPIIIYSGEGDNAPGSCTIHFEVDTFLANHQNYTWYTFTFSFAIPLLLIIISYFFVILKLRTVGPQNKSKEKKRSHRKVTNLVLAVIAVYVMCWLPYWVSQIAMISHRDNGSSSEFEKVLHILCSCLTYSNSAVNPILYAFLSDNFKKSFMKACTCAAGADINATLQMENSVFPRRNKHGNTQAGSQRFRQNRGGTGGGLTMPGGGGAGGFLAEEDAEAGGPLVSRNDPSTSAITMTSRSNITLTSNTDPASKDGSKDQQQMKDTVVKNGVGITFNC